MKNITLLMTCFFLTASVFGQISDKEKESERLAATMETKVESAVGEGEMMEKWLELIALGDEHERLKEDVGQYTYVNTMWTHPGAEAIKSEGMTTIEPIMEGRYLMEKHEGKAMGMPFYGMSIVGYDKIEKAYVSTWIDNMGTGILKFIGNHDDTGALVSKTHTINPMTGEKELHKIITKSAENGWEMDYYILTETDEKPFHTMHIVYTRIQ